MNYNDDYKEFVRLIKEWSKDRNIHEGDPDKQFLKVVEEVGELAGALARKKGLDVRDAIGDIFVTLVIICQRLDYELIDCIGMAYNEIENRKGKTVDGVFQKEED